MSTILIWIYLPKWESRYNKIFLTKNRALKYWKTISHFLIWLQGCFRFPAHYHLEFHNPDSSLPQHWQNRRVKRVFKLKLHWYFCFVFITEIQRKEGQYGTEGEGRSMSRGGISQAKMLRVKMSYTFIDHAFLWGCGGDFYKYRLC